MFTIGEFSRLCHVSARMLRHYDAIGLLRPALVGRENGYRFYDASQLAVLARIELLKGFGFALAEIADMLTLTEGELAQRVHSRRLEAYREVSRLKKTIRNMEDDIARMEGKNLSSDRYHVIVMPCPPQRVLSIRKKIHIGEVRELFDELNEKMTSFGLTRAGATQMLYHGEEFSYENMDVEAQVQVAGEHSEIVDVPAQLCVATTHIGPYDTINRAYDAVCAWMAEHPEYKVCGAPIERYIRDEDIGSDPEEFETGVLFPVVKQG